MFSWIRVTLVMVIDRKLATKNNNRNKYPQNITRVSMFDSAFGSRFLLQHDVRSIFDSRLVVGWVRPRRGSHDFFFCCARLKIILNTSHQYTHTYTFDIWSLSSVHLYEFLAATHSSQVFDGTADKAMAILMARLRQRTPFANASVDKPFGFGSQASHWLS